MPGKKLDFDGLDLRLKLSQLRHQRSQRTPCQGRDGIVVGAAALEDAFDEFGEALAALCGDEAELGEMTAQSYHRYCRDARSRERASCSLRP